MEQNQNQHMRREAPRPEFPKRAVVTGGMPYGNKSLHFGHVGGVFVFADVYARFLRDRIGADNVLFVSGTDCYGSPIAETYRKLCASGSFSGSMEDYVRGNHEDQKKTLSDYKISTDIFAASGLDRAAEIHRDVTDRFIRNLYENGHLRRITTSQFYDEKAKTFLNGRQVVGKCPVQGCSSEHGYADECDLGHQYMPESLIDPKSTLTGETPVMRDVTNWYFNLTEHFEELREFTASLRGRKEIRPLVAKTLDEFLKLPVIYVKNEFLEQYRACADAMPAHRFLEEPKKPSFTLEFDRLPDCDAACRVLSGAGIRYRTGKTLVPFRLTGNIPWGVPAPKLEQEEPGTVWVWPESLWAPISFSVAALEQKGRSPEDWKQFWCSKDAKIYQFIGQDNLYFYGIAEPAMFMAQQGTDGLSPDPEEGQLQMPTLIAAHHVLFLDKKASSSGAVKPPMAADLLNYYTAEQLRMHFLGLGLGQRSVSFMPKPFNPAAKPEDPDPVVKDGFLLSNVLNRMIRTCFYTVQKHYDGVMPEGTPDEEILAAAKKAVLDYERFLYRFEFHQATYVLDTYIRKGSKYMAKQLGDADKQEDDALRRKTLVNVFHIIRTAAALLHPMAPDGTEMIREYLGLPDSFWSWDTIFEPLSYFLPAGHRLKFLPPRTDFFTRHPSQFEQGES